MSLYERLGLQRGADSQEIRKAYLKLSKTEHPDKGGDTERFKKIQQAYEVLSDEGKRSFYDQTGQIPGEEGSPSGPGGGPGFPGGTPFPFDIGSMFGGMFGGGMFSGGGRPGGAQRVKRPKGPSKIHEIGLTLHDYFYGKKIQLKIERQKFCETCKGAGAESFENCQICGGSGFREQAIMIGPGMMATSRGPCGPCNGEGRQPKGSCAKCNGAKFKNQEKVLTVNIEPGMKPGESIVFHNECSDQHEYDEPGDVNIVLREADEASTLSRTGDDLKTVVNISLQQALVGGTVIVYGHPAHPKGLHVETPIGSMRGDVITVVGQGMPRRGADAATQRGNLYVTVAVDVLDCDKELLAKNKDALVAMFN